jgi:hypothetical protein
MFTAYAQVKTKKAERYLKALCNHFNQKISATYSDHHGEVQFGFGYCEMDAESNMLVLLIQADDDENFTRVKYIVTDHLERFAKSEGLVVNWVNPTE